MIGNNNVKLQGNVSALYGISEALRVFCQCGAPFKKILVIRESKSKSTVGKNAEMVLVTSTSNALRRTLARTVVKSSYVQKISCTLRLMRSE